MARPIDADAFDRALQDAQAECRKQGGNFRYGVLSTVRANLAMMPTVEMPGWVSVQDRLPEYTGWYLTYHHKINLCVVSWFTGDGWEDGDWGAYEDGWFPIGCRCQNRRRR